MKWWIISLVWVVFLVVAVGCGVVEVIGFVEGGIDVLFFFTDIGTNVNMGDEDVFGVKDILVGLVVDVDVGDDVWGDVEDSEEDVDDGGGIVILFLEPDVALADGDAIVLDGGDEVDSGFTSECITSDQCFVTDLCFDSVCFEGDCIKVMNTVFCDDGDGCTVDDVCSQGICMGVFMGSCSDDDFCIVNDVCVDGGCEGTPMDCDDANDCSIDFCYEGECKHLVMDVLECKLGIEIFLLDWVEMIIFFVLVMVLGKLVSLVGFVELIINGEDVGVVPNGIFIYVLSVWMGINIMIIEVVDSFE